MAIGREVREFRKKLDMTVAELAGQAELSAGMLSKIENGMTSPSLDTLQALSKRAACAGHRLLPPLRGGARRHLRAGGAGPHDRAPRHARRPPVPAPRPHPRRNIAVEPYLITLTEQSDVFPIFQHAGVEFLYMLEGEVGYRHGNKTYVMKPGDSLFFDADVPHGPDELRKLPIRFLSIICYAREEES